MNEKMDWYLKELNRFNNFDTKYADDKRNRDNKLIDLPCSGYVDVDCIYSLRKSFYCCFYLLSNRWNFYLISTNISNDNNNMNNDNNNNYNNVNYDINNNNNKLCLKINDIWLSIK